MSMTIAERTRVQDEAIAAAMDAMYDDPEDSRKNYMIGRRGETSHNVLEARVQTASQIHMKGEFR